MENARNLKLVAAKLVALYAQGELITDHDLQDIGDWREELHEAENELKELMADNNTTEETVINVNVSFDRNNYDRTDIVRFFNSGAMQEMFDEEFGHNDEDKPNVVIVTAK